MNDLTFLNCQTHEELVECVADVYGQAMTKNRALAYVHVLGKLALEHVGTAAAELLGKSKWMPTPAEWREMAAKHSEDARRRQRMTRLHVEDQDAARDEAWRRMTPEQRRLAGTKASNELRARLKERADAGEDWAKACLKYLTTGIKTPSAKVKT